MGGGSCPTGYNLLGQPTGQLRELVEGAAAQQIIIPAANQSTMEFVEGQLPYKIISGRWLPNRIQFIRAADMSAEGIG